MASESSSSDPELAEWHNDKDLLPVVENFHAIYAMPPDKLAKMKDDCEHVLNKFVEYIDFCIDRPIKGIGGSYEGVKVVKSEEDDDFEFDVMFVLKIPDGCKLEIMEIPGRHGYALLKVVNGRRDSPAYYRSINHKFFAGCLTFENDACIVDAGKTTAAFFGELQKWMNTKPIPGYDLRPKQHGTAIQMDVIEEQIGENKKRKVYSVDIVPTFEIGEGKGVKRYVTKPEKKQTPDHVTWRRMFDSEDSASATIQLARNILRSAADELRKQLFEYCASCKGICQGSCIVLEAARTRLPLPDQYLMKLQEALVGRGSSYRLTLINLQELNNGKNKRLVAVNYFFENEFDVIPVPEKPAYAWLKFERDAMEAAGCSRYDKALKLCYLPGGKYLDIKAASDMLVQELRDIATDLFTDEEVNVRREGPNVRIDVYPERGNKMLYYCLGIVLAVYVGGNFYIGLPHDYDDVPDKKAWRRSYSYEETEKIRQAPEGLKMVFRVLKALRNGEPGLAQLTSYHFKTLLLNIRELEIVNWNDNIYKILIRVLKHLKICLNEKKLPTNFIPEINLLEPMLNDCSVNMKNRIDELLRSKRKLLKALGDQKKETTDDILKQHRNESAQVFVESGFAHGLVHGCLKTQLVVEINKQLLGYDYTTITSNPVYEDIAVYKICPNEVSGLDNINALLLIHDNRKNLRVCRYNYTVFRLKHCNSTVSNSLLQTVPHSSGLADTRKTAEYIKQQMEKSINKSSLLRDNISVHLERSVIILKSNCDLQFNILTGYEVDEGFFIDMPEEPGTSAWCPIPFTLVRNKVWKAFKINKCGRRVLSNLRVIQNREPRLAKLNEKHLRMAIFWEMEVERDWSDEKMEERFRDVLDRLLVSIKKKNLQDYFYPERNTL